MEEVSMKKMLCILSLLVAAAVVMPSAKANALLDGTSVTPTLDDFSNLGTLLASITETLNPLSQSFAGTEYEAVYQQASGAIAFVLQFNVTAGANASDSIIRTTLNSTAFPTYTTSVAYRDVAFDAFSASSYAPTTADRNSAGDTVGFGGFGVAGAGVPTGSSSAALIIFTNASTYKLNAFPSVSDGGTSTSLGYGPSGAAIPSVPEPATFVLTGAALIGLGLKRRRGGASSSN